MLQPGLTYTCSRIVEEHHLAAHAAMCCVAPYLEEGQTTVGGEIAV